MAFLVQLYLRIGHEVFKKKSNCAKFTDEQTDTRTDRQKDHGKKDDKERSLISSDQMS